MNLNELFVPYEESLELKKLGLNKPCIAFYDRNHGTELYTDRSRLIDYSSHALEYTCEAPTFSQAFRFFREKYDCSHNITKTISGEYIPYVNGYELDLDDNCEEVVGFKWIYKTYEEAELACLRKLIEIVKTLKP